MGATMAQLKRLVCLMETERETLEMTDHSMGGWTVDTKSARAVCVCDKCGVLAEINAKAGPGERIFDGEAYSLACNPDDTGVALPPVHKLADLWPTFNPAYDFVYSRFSRFTEPQVSHWVNDNRISQEAFDWLRGAGYLETVGPHFKTMVQYKVIRFDVLTA
jgi:hypothetical protein